MNATHSAPSSQTAPQVDSEIVARLRGSDLFRNYQEAFQATTGLPLVLRAAGGFGAPFEGARNVSSLSRLMFRSSKTCAEYLRAQAAAELHSADGAATVEALAGLQVSVCPVTVGDHTVAFLETGQVRCKPATEKQFVALLESIRALGVELEETALRAAFFEVRVIARPNYEATTRLLAAFAKHLAAVAGKMTILAAHHEHPCVTRARSFIEQNLTEEFSLDTVARFAGMSPFYFCKIFKTDLGVTYTDYVARERIARVKTSMLNPQTRVSEAAYAAGFQSLSQFNRVFRRVVGESPSDFRSKLMAQSGGLN